MFDLSTGSHCWITSPLFQFQFHDHDKTAWWMLGLRLRILTCHVNLKTLKEESWMLQVPGKVGSSSEIKQGMHGQHVHADCASFSSHLAFIDLKPTKKDPTWSESADRWIIATLQWPNQSLLITRFELIFTSLISSTYPPKVLQEITAPPYHPISSSASISSLSSRSIFSSLAICFPPSTPIFSAPEIGANHHDRHAITLPLPCQQFFSGALGCFFCTVSNGTGPEACRVTELLGEISDSHRLYPDCCYIIADIWCIYIRWHLPKSIQM